MNNLVIFHLTFWDFIRKGFLHFLKFYVLFFLLMLLIMGFDIFSIFFPIIIFIAFLLTNRILVDIRLISSSENAGSITITYLKFLILKKTVSSPIENVAYSYREEKTSRLASADVLTVYFNEIEVFKRYHPLDGVTENDTFNIIEEFEKLGIKKVN